MTKQYKKPVIKKFIQQIREEGYLPFKLFRIFSYPAGRNPVPHEELGHLKDLKKMQDDVAMNNILFPHNPKRVVLQQIQMVDSYESKRITEDLMTRLRQGNLTSGPS